MSETAKQVVQNEVKITKKDLPLCCPPQGAENAGLHPRVYLPIEKSGRETCPYCGTNYVLE